MVVGCRVKNPNQNNYYEPIAPPIVVRITSSETGDVQYITFAQNVIYGIGIIDVLGTENAANLLCIAYISPVKYDQSLGKMVTDPTKQELNISPNGDTLIAEIMYKDQLLKKTIIVKGK